MKVKGKFVEKEKYECEKNGREKRKEMTSFKVYVKKEKIQNK